jgi:hypothetical protein
MENRPCQWRESLEAPLAWPYAMSRITTEINMKQYIGTKQINAKPMARLEYNEFRGWELPADENGADEGYLVEYVGPGQKANTPEYEGYVSWSPKDVFEATYKVADTFIDRLTVEYDELNEKHEKLSAFLMSEKFYELTDANATLLRFQHIAMKSYLEILGMRLKLLQA